MNMKAIRKYLVLTMVSIVVITSCKDESLQVVPVWESAVHGFATVTSSNKDFLYNTPTAPIDVDLKWISIDGKLTVTKIEVYALFNENYIDQDGNPKIAAHGGETGELIASYDGSAVPANRTAVKFSVTQDQLYNLYKDREFDYDGEDGPKPSVNVFTNPDKPQRDATHHFMWDDKIELRWEYTTEDGRVFKKWGTSVCTEFPGANCSVNLSIICATDLAPASIPGNWTFDMQDTYGDGWQGGFISVVVNGTEFAQVKIPNGGGSSLQTILAIPATATSMKFNWSNDSFNGECVFKITSPKGNVVANVSTPSPGPIKLDLCLE
jgi:hypothetical protein